jgi:hypothetical protein
MPLHGGKSTGHRTKAGIHRIRKALWKHGSRSKRLLEEARRLAAEQEREYFNELTKDWTPTTIAFRRLLGMPDFPKVKVRVRLNCPDGPPERWKD